MTTTSRPTIPTPPSGPALLGLDLGTSGATALLLGGDLSVLTRSARPVQTFYPQPGHVEQDPHALLEAVRQVGRDVLAGRGQVAAAGFANPGESVLAWDARTGEPLTPVVVWSDTRAHSICAELRGAGQDAEVARLSGLPLDPYFCAAKFGWLLRHDARTRAARAGGHLRLCTVDAWIALRLGGGYVTDHSTASRTQLYDMTAGQWSPALLDLFGVPPLALPEIRPGLSPAGQLALDGTTVPWRAALLDQVAALVGSGCLESGEAKVTYGTGAFVLAQAGPEPRQVTGLLSTVGLSDARSRSFILDGGVYSAGSALQWLERLGVLPHASAVDELAEGASGARLRFLPAFSGLGAPWWDASARGVLSGLEADSGPAEVTRAVLDGIAARVTDILEVMQGELPAIRHLRADGGLSRSRYLMQRQADLSALPVRRSEEEEATALGVALSAGVAAGILDWTQVTCRTAGAGHYQPQWPEPARRLERERWQEWARAAAALERRDPSEPGRAG